MVLSDGLGELEDKEPRSDVLEMGSASVDDSVRIAGAPRDRFLVSKPTFASTSDRTKLASLSPPDKSDLTPFPCFFLACAEFFDRDSLRRLADQAPFIYLIFTILTFLSLARNARFRNFNQIFFSHYNF
jgi:hypothetical protein